jgi:hypothetical protein
MPSSKVDPPENKLSEVDQNLIPAKIGRGKQ